jgi:hypothetical protein
VGAVIVALGGALAIASTYRVFSQTHDEPAHIAAGMEWLTAGEYTFEVQHPPLARLAAAVGPYFAGERTSGNSMWVEGARILGRGDHYTNVLALARLGELPFFLLLCCVVWSQGRRIAGEAGGTVAVFFIASNPNILAHAGLATTDIAPTALFAASLLAFVRWLERADRSRSLILGATIGLAVVTKFSTIAFLGPTLVIGYGLWAHAKASWRFPVLPDGPRPLASAGIVVGGCAFTVWACYGFAVGPVATGIPLWVPAPAFFQGVADFATHGSLGHTSFLLGRISSKGWWYYFPIVLLVKTPIPLLVLSFLGAWVAIADSRRHGPWDALLPIAASAVILAVGMATRVDIGVRHILPLYPQLALLAAYGSVAAWERWTIRSSPPALRNAVRASLGLATAASVGIVLMCHPDHLAYFNSLAGRHPEHVLSDSNLDWGQDLYRLAAEIRERRIASIRLAYFGSADPAAAGVVNATPLGHNERASGWIAVSETYLAGVWSDRGYVWLRAYVPVARVGRSMRLYWFPPSFADADRAGSVIPPSPISRDSAADRR